MKMNLTNLHFGELMDELQKQTWKDGSHTCYDRSLPSRIPRMVKQRLVGFEIMVRNTEKICFLVGGRVTLLSFER
jgi:hypothetical protein